MVENDSSAWFTRKKATAYLSKIGCPVSPQTLANLAVHENSGHGPPFSRIGKKIIRYSKEDLDTWAATKTVRVR